MNKAAKRRRKALARQVREQRTQLNTALASRGTKSLHRFTCANGIVAGANVLYSDEECE